MKGKPNKSTLEARIPPAKRDLYRLICKVLRVLDRE